jgi:hypothetical protein
MAGAPKDDIEASVSSLSFPPTGNNQRKGHCATVATVKDQ